MSWNKDNLADWGRQNWVDNDRDRARLAKARVGDGVWRISPEELAKIGKSEWHEGGSVGETNWSLLDSTGDTPWYMLRFGKEDGDAWVPGETNTSIRPGWFYHETEDEHVKSLSKLMDTYYRSVGRNSTLLLNWADWRTVAEGEFSNVVNNPIWQTVRFAPVKAGTVSISGSPIRAIV